MSLVHTDTCAPVPSPFRTRNDTCPDLSPDVLLHTTNVSSLSSVTSFASRTAMCSSSTTTTRTVFLTLASPTYHETTSTAISPTSPFPPPPNTASSSTSVLSLDRQHNEPAERT